MNLALLSIDNLRFDCAGYQPDQRELERHDVRNLLRSETLDRIAERSLCFTKCISTNTYTTASHASIFTGVYPPRHGVRAFFSTKLGPARTLAERLKAEGYRTVLYSDALELFCPLGLHRGFDNVLTGNDGDLFRLLRNFRDEKVFLFAHFMDVHEPYLKCEQPYAPGVNDDFQEVMEELYRAAGLLKAGETAPDPKRLNWRYLLEHALTDRPIETLLPLYVRGVTKFDGGRLRFFLDQLSDQDFFDDAMAVVLSDHGEGRCFNHPDRKGFFGHGGSLYDNVIRVPLMICHPDIHPGVEDRLASTVDVVPTVLKLLGLECPEALDGVSLLDGGRERAYSELWISSTEAASFIADFKRETAARKEVDAGQWPEFLRCHTSVRTERGKYLLWNRGKIERFLGEERFGLPEADFVRSIYREILGRFEDEKGLKHFTGILREQQVSKRQLLAAFLVSDEYRYLEQMLPRYSYYDPEQDPEEDAPVNVAGDRSARPHFDFMERLNTRAVETEKIHEGKIDYTLATAGAPETGEEVGGDPANPDVEKERAVLLGKLKNLGYF